MLQFVGCATKSMKGCDSVGHASRSSGLLCVEASLARVSQCSLKTGGDATVGGARDISQRWRWSQVEDGWVDVTGCTGPFYPTFAVFNVLGTRGIIVI
jgi:hypothetical protein